jgi:hypothetical protein
LNGSAFREHGTRRVALDEVHVIAAPLCSIAGDLDAS